MIPESIFRHCNLDPPVLLHQKPIASFGEEGGERMSARNKESKADSWMKEFERVLEGCDNPESALLELQRAGLISWPRALPVQGRRSSYYIKG